MTDILRTPERSGATSFLLCHIWGQSLIRQISVTKDFNPGCPPLNYLSLSEETRAALQYHLRQLNNRNSLNFDNSYDPRHAVWAVHSVYLLRGELLFIAENLTVNHRPKSRRDPTLILHLGSLPGDNYELRNELVVSNTFQPNEAVYPYFSATKSWRKAIKEQLHRVNNHDDDMRNHAFALASVHSISQGKQSDVVGVVLVLHWQSCEPESAMLEAPSTPSLRPSRNGSPRRRWVTDFLTHLNMSTNYERSIREDGREGGLPPYSV